MQITHIDIDGFRSIRDLEFDVEGNLQIFIGKNDSGKSNILRALDLFFNNTIDKLALDWERDFNITYQKARGKNAPTHITITISFALDKAYSKSKKYTALLENLGTNFTISKKISRNNRIDLYFSKDHDSIDDSLLEEENPKFSSVIDFLSHIHYLYIPINKDENWLKESYIFQDIKNRFIDAWGKGGETQSSIVSLKKNIENMLQNLKEIVDNGMTEISEEFRNLFPQFKQVTFQTPKSANELFSLLEIEVLSENNISTTLGLRGAGVQSASVPLLLYYVDTGKAVSARTSLYFPIWGIEEPESFQHDDLQEQIAEFFHDKVQKKIPAFITTHSGYYLDPHNSKNIHLCQMEKTGTVFSSSNADWEKYLAAISLELGYLNYPADIFMLLQQKHDTNFIVLEGKYDIDVFKKVCALDNDIKEKYAKYEIIDGQGANLPEKVKLLDKAQKNIIVILDKDKDGESYKATLSKYDSKRIKIFHYFIDSSSDNIVLETLIPHKIKDAFKNQMPKEAVDYWYSSKSKIDMDVYGGVPKAPKNWDKDNLKNKLCEYYINYSQNKMDYDPFIKFYEKLEL